MNSQSAIRNRNGFTLIELLIATLIVGLMIGLVYSSFNVGLDSWQKGEERTDVIQALRASMDKMTVRIENAFFSPLNPDITFVGHPERLEFISTTEDEGGLLKVGLYSDPETRRLLITEGPLWPDLSESFKLSGRLVQARVILAEEISALHFEYYNPRESSWETGWDSKDKAGLPGAVKIIPTLFFAQQEVNLPPFVIPIYVGNRGCSGEVNRQQASTFPKALSFRED